MLFFKKKIFVHTYVDLITSLLNPCQNQKATDLSKFQQNKLWFFFSQIKNVFCYLLLMLKINGFTVSNCFEC